MSTDVYTCPHLGCDYVIGAVGPIVPGEPDYYAEDIAAHRRSHESVRPFRVGDHVQVSRKSTATPFTSTGTITEFEQLSDGTPLTMWIDLDKPRVAHGGKGMVRKARVWVTDDRTAVHADERDRYTVELLADEPTDTSDGAVTQPNPAPSDAPTPEPFSVEGMRIVSGWLVEPVNGCTCGGEDQYGHEAHEPGCGLEPIAQLDDLDGWPGEVRTTRPTTAEAIAAIEKRLSWASLHWGTEKVHPDAWVHIADAVLNLWDPEVSR